MEIPGLGKAAVDVPGKLIKVDKIMRINKETIDGLIAGGPLGRESAPAGAGLARVRRHFSLRPLRRLPGGRLHSCERSRLPAFADVAKARTWAIFSTVHAISKRFGGVVALRDVDLSCAAGEVHCLVGENGSGKSRSSRSSPACCAPEPEGRIVIEGREYPHLNPVQSTACGIQVIYQDLSLFPNLTVAENIAIARHLGAAAGR